MSVMIHRTCSYKRSYGSLTQPLRLRLGAGNVPTGEMFPLVEILGSNKPLNLFKPYFSHLYNEDKNRIYTKILRME